MVDVKKSTLLRAFLRLAAGPGIARARALINLAGVS